MKRILAFFGTSIVLAAQLLLIAPVHAATAVSITSPTSGSTETGTSFTVTGTATADRKITVEVDGDEVGTTTSDGSGDWTLEVTGQDAGSKTITATASVQYAYVGNSNSATISVINTITDEVVNTVSSTTNTAGGIAISPDGTQMVSVSGYGGDGTVRVYSLADPETPTITNNITAANDNAVNVIYSPSGTHFYVSSVQDGFGASAVTRYVSATPGTTAAVTGFNQAFPAGMAFSSDGATLYVSNVISGTLSVINAGTNSQSSSFLTGGATYAGIIVLSDNDNDLYISSANQDAAIPVNIAGASAGTGITIGDEPQSLTFNSDQSRVIVANSAGNTLSSINTATNTVASTVSTGASTSPMFPGFNSDFSKLYVTFRGTDRVGVLDPDTLATTATITVGDQPVALALAPVESASDEVTFSLLEEEAVSTSSAEALADTGQNTYLYFALACTLLIIPSVYIKKRLFNR